MKLGTKLALTVGSVGAITLLWPRKPAWELVSGPPVTRDVSYSPPDRTGQYVHVGPAMALLQGKPLPRMINPGTPVGPYQVLALELQQAWKARQATLPAGTQLLETDRYSKELYFVPSWLLNVAPSKLTADDVRSAASGAPVDEFGRRYPGHYGESDQSLWGQTLGGLLSNPLGQKIFLAAMVAAGPEAWAAYGAYRMWQLRGSNLTVKNVALAAGRTAAETQCGPACGAAFDFGAGIASGQSANKASEQALMNSMTPEQRVVFEQGKTQVHKMGL